MTGGLRERKMRNRDCRGFTLIELLVVVAIIALLIAIMLPSLGRAHELARRAACRGNVRAIAVALVSYAQDNDDAVPLACWQSGRRAVRRMNYFISYVTPNAIASGHPSPDGHLGLLIQPGNEYMDNAKNFYCPSATEGMWQFDTESNYWWDNPNRPGGNAGRVRLGYGTRPVIGWFSRGRPPWRGPDDPPLTAQQLYNSNGNLPRMSTPTPLHYNGRRMMISFRSTDAMVADVSNTPWRVDKFHGEGVNVGWFDGSVHWFDCDGFNDVWQQWPAAGYGNATVEDDCHYELTPGVAGEVTVTGVWAEMGG